MQLCFLITDTLSHNIISHKRDEPITRVVSKYRIQMEYNSYNLFLLGRTSE